MNTMDRFLEEEDGMGVVEVILIIVVLVAVVAIFKTKITGLVETLWKSLAKDAKKILK